MSLFSFFTGQLVDHLVINCDKEVIKYHCYWPVISDFINIVTHHKIAYIFMKDSELLEKWMNFVACVTGMNQIKSLSLPIHRVPTGIENPGKS